MQCSEAALLSYKWVIHHFLDMYFFYNGCRPQGFSDHIFHAGLEENLLLQEDAVNHNVPLLQHDGAILCYRVHVIKVDSFIFEKLFDLLIYKMQCPILFIVSVTSSPVQHWGKHARTTFRKAFHL